MDSNLQAVQAVLREIQLAMKELLKTGATYSIYLQSTGLTEEEQVTVMETLGKGKLTISFTETDQPAEWYETSFSGVWVGNYYNQRDDVMVYSIEVCRYPLVAGAFDEDIEEGIADLQHWIEAADL